LKREKGKRQVDCKDGRVKTVFEDPDKAAPLYMKDWSVKVDGAVSATREFEAKIGTDLKSEVSGLFLEIDEANKSMQGQFRMAYVLYSDDPCKFDDWLAIRICEILARENRLRNLTLEIKMLENLVKAGAPKAVLTQAISKSIRKLSQGDIDGEVLDELSAAQSNVSTWEGITP
jgi:hypothetical protein